MARIPLLVAMLCLLANCSSRSQAHLVEQLRSDLLVGMNEWEVKSILDARHVEYGVNPATGDMIAMVRTVEKSWVTSKGVQISLSFDESRIFQGSPDRTLGGGDLEADFMASLDCSRLAEFQDGTAALGGLQSEDGGRDEGPVVEFAVFVGEDAGGVGSIVGELQVILGGRGLADEVAVLQEARDVLLALEVPCSRGRWEAVGEGDHAVWRGQRNNVYGSGVGEGGDDGEKENEEGVSGHFFAAGRGEEC